MNQPIIEGENFVGQELESSKSQFFNIWNSNKVRGVLFTYAYILRISKKWSRREHMRINKKTELRKTK